MNSPFISVKTLVIGAAIFGIIISGGILVGTLIPRNEITTNGGSHATATSSPASAPAPVTPSTFSSTSSSATKPKAIVTKPAADSEMPELSFSVAPWQIIEGDPVMITVNESKISNIKSASLTAPGPNISGGKSTVLLHFIEYQNQAIAFYGTGINQVVGKATVSVTMKDGTKLTTYFTIAKRQSPTENLPVPEQLGGNSTSSQQQLVSNLDAENARLADIYSNPSAYFWTAPFGWPIHPADVAGGIVVTDPFGYNRDSGAETIIHKGTDFKAPPGTPVYAINAGYVRISQLFTVYGNTVVVDHGMGIQSFYMHLSRSVVQPGEAVKKGQLLGYSGETGYSEGPHLHLTIRIGGISIDPMVFYGLFGLQP